VREHQRIGKTGAGLAELDKGAVEIEQLRNLADVGGIRRAGVAVCPIR
jgi:hypothetical protein